MGSPLDWVTSSCHALESFLRAYDDDNGVFHVCLFLFMYPIRRRYLRRGSLILGDMQRLTMQATEQLGVLMMLRICESGLWGPY